MGVPLRIIQISDIHLFENSEKSLLGVNTRESFSAVIDLVQKEKMDLIILSGDLSQDGSQTSYIQLAEMLKHLKIPVYCIPGNHDNSKAMAQVFPRDNISNHRHIILKNWQLILLDSQKPGKVEGQLDASQLDYLQHCLHTYPEHNAIIVFHHQPLKVHSEWLDNLGIQNANDFWKVVSRYPKVNTVLFGHVHQVYEQISHGIKCYSVPSTCFQFMRKQDQFGLENLPPGYRWVDLYEDGRLETGVVRIDRYVGTFEKDSKGYE